MALKRITKVSLNYVVLHTYNFNFNFRNCKIWLETHHHFVQPDQLETTVIKSEFINCTWAYYLYILLYLYIIPYIS